jgi:hypothetical protein
MPTNIKLTVANFVRVDGYFYHLAHTNDTLFKKVDSGENAFSYPLDTDLLNEIKCIQHDGRFFYTLENLTAANSGNGQLILKKWKIEDFVLKLKRTYTLNGSGAQKYDCNSFAIEHFHRTFGAVASAGVSTITLNSNDRVSPGDILQLGPSTFTGDEGKTEEVTVGTVLVGNQVTLTTPLVNSYNNTNLIDFSKRCWFFNKFRPSDPDPTNGSGQLFSFDLNPIITTVVARKTGNEFRTVLASTFMTDPFYAGGPRDFLVYANQTNLLFIETQDTNPNFLLTVQSAAQNNQETNSNVITIHDITHEGNTIFRLQNKATYKTGVSSTTEDWGAQFNYQVAPIQRLPLSISLTANPAVIAADGVATSNITAIVKDQFDSAIASRLVSFTDNDATGAPAGAMIPTSATTNSQGSCNVNYRAGTEAKTVTVTAST